MEQPQLVSRHLQDEVATEEEIRTGHDVTRVHRIFVLDEAKAIHQLDLGNLAGATGVEVVLNIGLGSCITIPVSIARSGRQSVGCVGGQ